MVMTRILVSRCGASDIFHVFVWRMRLDKREIMVTPNEDWKIIGIKFIAPR